MLLGGVLRIFSSDIISTVKYAISCSHSSGFDRIYNDQYMKLVRHLIQTKKEYRMFISLYIGQNSSKVSHFT